MTMVVRLSLISVHVRVYISQNMVPTSSRSKPEEKAMMLVLRHLLHHKKSTVFLFFHMYMLLWAVLLSSPTCPHSIVQINSPN